MQTAERLSIGDAILLSVGSADLGGSGRRKRQALF